MPARAKAKPEGPIDPDKLLRESAGVYRTADGRFEVRQSDAAWYLVDHELTNDFGQELIHGPLATLKEAREQIPGARKVTPLARPKISAAARRAAEAEVPAPPPKSWIDRLPDDEAKPVRRLIAALEREGVSEAEQWARDARDGRGSSLATRLIEHRLHALLAEGDSEDRRHDRELIEGMLAVLTESGATVREPLPRWALVELEPDKAPDRRLRPKV